MSLPASIDDLGLAVADLKRTLAKPASQRDAQWAYDVCTYTRFVHFNVWDSSPPRARVREEIIPLLSRARSQLAEFSKRCRRNRDIQRASSYLANVDLRLRNLDRYARSLFPLSDFSNHRSLGKDDSGRLKRVPATSK